ncbi:MAG TPA: aldehyde dehydrogenase family protein, partial [Solirubrobacteraceae bacterium]|nr:aldehyde dehydrogenase family protein [Solirubrobacteraceae bacterium]
MAGTATSSEQQIVDGVPKGLYIGGEWRDASGGGTLGVEDPATGEIVAEVADAQVDDALAALGAAADAQREWAATPTRERGEILRRAYELILDRAGDLATLMTLEMGKPVAESKAEVLYAADFLHWYAGEATRIDGTYKPAEK